MGDKVDQLAVELIERAEESVAQPHGALHDRVEDRLHVGLRPAHDAQDFAGRGLLLERLGEIAVARPQLGEQPHVLDGDDRLIGKGLDERDLLLLESLGLRPPQGHRSDRLPRPQHRDGDLAPRPERLDHLPGQSGHPLFALDVPDECRLSTQDDPARDRVVAHRPRKDALELAETYGAEPVARHHIDHAAIEAVYTAESRAAEMHRPLDDDVEDRLHFGRRARDHTEDLRGRSLLLEGLADLGVGDRQGLVLFAELSEQPHVLDGDDGLVGEGLQHRDLRVRKRADLGAPDQQCAQRIPLPEEGDPERRSVPPPHGQLPARGELRCRRKVLDVDRPPAEDGATIHRSLRQRRPPT